MKLILIAAVLLVTSCKTRNAADAMAANSSVKSEQSTATVDANLDLIETSLRTIVNKAAVGGELPAELTSPELRFEAALYLIKEEVKYPGILLGKAKPSYESEQHQANLELFKVLSQKYQFFYAPAQQGQRSDKDILTSAGMDIAESSLRLMLGVAADGSQAQREISFEEKLQAALRLLNVELRAPGLLTGKLKAGFEWKQYQEVQSLFKRLQEEYSLKI